MKLLKGLFLGLFFITGMFITFANTHEVKADDPDFDTTLCSKLEYKLNENCKAVNGTTGLNTEKLNPCDIKLETNCTSGTNSKNLFTLITGILNTIFFILGFVAVVLIIFEGVLLIVENKEDRRKKIISTIINITLGFITIILSYTIVNFILGFIGADTAEKRTDLVTTESSTTPTENLYSSATYNPNLVTYTIEGTSIPQGGTYAFNDKSITKKNFTIVVNDGNLKTGYTITHNITGDGNPVSYSGTGQSNVIPVTVAYGQSFTLRDNVTVKTTNTTLSPKLNFTITNSATATTTPVGSTPTTPGGNTPTTTSSAPTYNIKEVEYQVSKEGATGAIPKTYVAGATIPIAGGADVASDAKVLVTITDTNVNKAFSNVNYFEHKILKSTGEVVATCGITKTTLPAGVNKCENISFSMKPGESLTIVDQISAVTSGDNNKKTAGTAQLYFSNGTVPKSGDTTTTNPTDTLSTSPTTQRLLVDATYNALTPEGTQTLNTVRLLANQSLYVPLPDSTQAATLKLEPKLYSNTTSKSLLKITTIDKSQKQIETKDIRSTNITNITGDAATINGVQGKTPDAPVNLSFPTPGVYTLRIDWLDETSTTPISTFTTPVNVYGDKTQISVSPHVDILGATFRVATYPTFSSDALLQKKKVDLLYYGIDGKQNEQNEYSKELLPSDGDTIQYAFMKPGYYTARLTATYQGAANPTIVADNGILVYPLSPTLDFAISPRVVTPGIYDITTSSKYLNTSTLSYTLSPDDGSTMIQGQGTEKAILTFTKAGTYKVTVSGENDFKRKVSISKTIRVDSLLSYKISFLGSQNEEVLDDAGIIFDKGKKNTAQLQGRSVDKVLVSLQGQNQSPWEMIKQTNPGDIANNLQTFILPFNFNNSGYFTLQFQVYEIGKTTPVQTNRLIYVKDESHPAAAFTISEVTGSGNIKLDSIPNLCKIQGGQTVDGYLVRKSQNYLLDGSYSLKNDGTPVDTTNTLSWFMNKELTSAYGDQLRPTIQFTYIDAPEGQCQKMSLSVVDKGVANTLTKYVRVENSKPKAESFIIIRPEGVLTAPVTVEAVLKNLADPDRAGYPKIRWYYTVGGKEMESATTLDAYSRNITVMPYGSAGTDQTYQICAEIFDADLANALIPESQKSDKICADPFTLKISQVPAPVIKITTFSGTNGGMTPWVVSVPVTLKATASLMTGEPVSSSARYIWDIEKASLPSDNCTDTSVVSKSISNSGLNLSYTFPSCGIYTVSVSIEDNGKTASDSVKFQVKTPSDITPEDQAVVDANTPSNSGSNSDSNSNSTPSGTGSNPATGPASDKTKLTVTPGVGKIGDVFRVDTLPQFSTESLLQKKTVDFVYLGQDGTQNQNEYTKTLQSKDGDRVEYGFLKAGYYTVRLSAFYQGSADPVVKEDRVLVNAQAPVVDFSLTQRSGNPSVYDISTNTKNIVSDSLSVKVSPDDSSTIIDKKGTTDAVLTFTKAGSYKVTVSGKNEFGQEQSAAKTVNVSSVLAYTILFKGSENEEIIDNAGIIFKSGQTFSAQVQGKSIEKVGMALYGANQSFPNMEGPTVTGDLQTFTKGFRFTQQGYFILQFFIYETGKTVPVQVSKVIYIKSDKNPAAAFTISSGNTQLRPVANLCKVGSLYMEGYVVRRNQDYGLDGSYSLKNNGLQVDTSNTFSWGVPGYDSATLGNQGKVSVRFKDLSLVSDSCQQMTLTVTDQGVTSTQTKYIRVQNTLPTYSSFILEKPSGLLTSPATVKVTLKDFVDPDRDGLPKIRWFYMANGQVLKSEESEDSSAREMTIMPYGSAGAIFTYQVGAQIFDGDLTNAAIPESQKSYTIYSAPFFVQTPRTPDPTVRIASPRGADGGKTIPWLVSSPVVLRAEAVLLNGSPVSSSAQYVWKVEKTTAAVRNCTETGAIPSQTLPATTLDANYTFPSCGAYSVSVTINDGGKTATDSVIFQVKKVADDLTPAEQAAVNANGNPSSNTTGNTNSNGNTASGTGSNTNNNGSLIGTTTNPNANTIVSNIINNNTNSDDDLPDLPPTHQVTNDTSLPTTNPTSNQPAYSNQTTVKPSAADVDEIKKLIQSIITSDGLNPSVPTVPTGVSGYNIIGPTSLVGCTNTVLVLNANAEARLACNDYNLYSSDASVIAEYLKRKDQNLYDDQFKALFDKLSTQTNADDRLDTFEQIIKKINTSSLSDADKAQLQKIASLISVAPVDKTLESKMVVDAVDNLKSGLINALTDSEKSGNTLLSQYFNALAGLKNSTVSVDVKSDKMEQALKDILNSSLIPDSTKQQIRTDVTTSTNDMVAKVSEIIKNTTTLSDSERKDLLERLNTLQNSYQTEDPVTRAKKIQDAILSLLNEKNIGSDVKTLITKEVTNSISRISDRTSERIGNTFTQTSEQAASLVKTLNGNLQSSSGMTTTITTLKDLQSSIANASWIPAADKSKIDSTVVNSLTSWLQDMKRNVEASTVLSSAEKDQYYKQIDALLSAKDSSVLLPQLEKQLGSWANDKKLTSDPVLYQKLISGLSVQADTALKNTRSIVNAIPVTSPDALAKRAQLVTAIDQKRQQVFPSSSILGQIAQSRTALGSISELSDQSKEVDAKILSALTGSVGEIEAIFDSEGGAIFKPYLDKYKQALAQAATSSDPAGNALKALNDLYTVIGKQDARYTNLKAKLGAYVESFSKGVAGDIDRVTKTSNTASFAAEKKIIEDTINRIKNGKMTVAEAAHELDNLKKMILSSEKIPVSVKQEMISALENDPTFQDYFKALRECTAVYVRGQNNTLQKMCQEELKNSPDLKPVATDELFSEMQKGKEAMMSSIDTIVTDPELKKALNILLERLVTDKTLTMEQRLKNTRLLLSLLEHPSLSQENRTALLAKLYAIPVIGDEIKVIQENDLATQSTHGAAPRELDQILKDILAATRPLASTQRSVIREMLLQIKNFYGKNPNRVDTAVSFTSRLVTDSNLDAEPQKKVQEMLIGLGRTDVAIDYGSVRPEITLDKLSHELDAIQDRKIYQPAKASFDTLLKATQEKDFLAAQGASAKLQDMIQQSSELNEPEKTPMLLDTTVTRDFYTYVAAKVESINANANQNQPPLEELPQTPATDQPSGFVSVLLGIGKFILGVLLFILLLGVGFYVSFLVYKGRHPDEHVDFEEYILNIREAVKKFFARFRKKDGDDEHLVSDNEEEALPRLPKDMESHEEEPVQAEVVEDTPTHDTEEQVLSTGEEDTAQPGDGATPSWLQMTPQIPTEIPEETTEPPAPTNTETDTIQDSGSLSHEDVPFFDPFAEPVSSPAIAPEISPEVQSPVFPTIPDMPEQSDPEPEHTNDAEEQNAPQEMPIFDPFADVNILPFEPAQTTPVADVSVPNTRSGGVVQNQEQQQTSAGAAPVQRPNAQRPYIPRNLQTAQQQVQSRGRNPRGGGMPRKPFSPNSGQGQPPLNN